jgi:hypothetical protein
MPTSELLPGVTTRECPPQVVCDARRAIRSARRRALARDVVQLALLVAVDYLFVRWPDARMPFANRGESLALLELVNGFILTHVALVRALPRWSARRIAATWCLTERRKFRTRS